MIRPAKLLRLALKLSKHFTLSTLLLQETIIYYKKLKSIRINETFKKDKQRHQSDVLKYKTIDNVYQLLHST